MTKSQYLKYHPTSELTEPILFSQLMFNANNSTSSNTSTNTTSATTATTTAATSSNTATDNSSNGQNPGDSPSANGSCDKQASPAPPPTATDDIPKGLATWREAVVRSQTSAQLAMCLYMLEASIAWDKSIMKAVSDHILFNKQRARKYNSKLSVGACASFFVFFLVQGGTFKGPSVTIWSSS